MPLIQVVHVESILQLQPQTQGAHPGFGGCFHEEHNHVLSCVMYLWRLMSGKPQFLVVQLKMQQMSNSKRSAVFTDVSHLL